MTVAAYMTACLHDPLDGYYATRPSLGADGDFVTAPLVSQMFGELIGLWAGEVWARLGAPAPFRLVELGPGDGTLMSDALRALRLVPALLDAAEVWLVEPSAPLRAAQAARLGPTRVEWTSSLGEVPNGQPIILLANEVLDCLPARQFVRAAAGWAERRVGLDDNGRLAFGLSPPPRGLDLPGEAPEGAVLERSPAQAALGSEIGARLVCDGGAALLIDYGSGRPGYGDTLQALSRHRAVPPLETPGEADLTVHADFAAVAAAAVAAGGGAAPLATQRAFLQALGIEARAAALARSRPDLAGAIGRQLDRLIGEDQMGALFKVLCLHAPGLPPPGLSQLGFAR